MATKRPIYLALGNKFLTKELFFLWLTFLESFGHQKFSPFMNGKVKIFGVHMNQKGLSQEKISLLWMNSDMLRRIIQ